MDKSTHRQIEDADHLADRPGADVTEHVRSSPNTKYGKHSSKGILLVPQPSDDPRDPLNWPTYRKLITLAIICLAGWSVLLSALANASGFFFQAKLYHKTPVQVSYSASAAIAGVAAGPFFWTPIAARYGKAGVLFWSLILAMGANIWSACMTKDDQYNAFVVSRLFASLFGSSALTLGSNFIVELFFLHDRGKCFALYTFSILMGAISCGTFSGYIVQFVGWPVQFWYNVGLEGFLAVLCLLFLDETLWSRGDQSPVPYPPAGFLKRKLATYFFTQRLTPKRTKEEVIRSITLPFTIMFCPISIIVGLVLLIIFAWGIAINTFLSIFLQNPLDEGGYAFSPGRNASFTFTLWVAALAAELYGTLVADRLPLALCARNGGVWKPEYRLHSTWFPLLVCTPLGVGLFGATIHYHWHYMVLAFAVFLSNFGNISAYPALLNYVIEAFSTKLANEVSVGLNFYRSTLSIGITFFLFPWSDKIGVNWAFGMMSFFSLLAFGGVILCMVWGPKIRSISLLKPGSEEGIHIVNDKPEMRETSV